MSDANQSRQGEPGNPGDGENIPLSDAPLLDLLDALVEQRGKVAAADALGVNFRTMTACHESRRVSRRMRRALEEYRDAHVDGADEQEDDGGVAEKVEALERRVGALEEAYGALVETVEAQAKRLAALEPHAGESEDGERRETGSDASEDDGGRRTQWRAPRRGHGLPDAGVVTLEEQPDEERAFGPAAPLVAEWRRLRIGGAALGGRVDRAKAAVRRWELEIAMLGDFGLTLPPETEPMDASRREDHVRWRREALAGAGRELARAKRIRLLTLGLWRR